MPDITSARPVSGAPVATAWGAEVHDQLEGIQAGKQACSISASTAGTVAVVTFPRAYTVAPIVVAVAASAAGVWAVVTAVTATNVSLQLRAPASSTITLDVHWIAIGTPA